MVSQEQQFQMSIATNGQWWQMVSIGWYDGKRPIESSVNGIETTVEDFGFPKWSTIGISKWLLVGGSKWSAASDGNGVSTVERIRY